MFFDTPVIEIRVNKPAVDVIHASVEQGAGWKIDGWKDDQHGRPDELQDTLDCIVRSLAPYVDETSVWTNLETGKRISSWEAILILSGISPDDALSQE
jgi:hypothetical protein